MNWGIHRNRNKVGVPTNKYHYDVSVIGTKNHELGEEENKVPPSPSMAIFKNPIYISRECPTHGSYDTVSRIGNGGSFTPPLPDVDWSNLFR